LAPGGLHLAGGSAPAPALVDPPFRIAQSPYAAESCVWLPALGWQRADQDLYERLERAFSIPMLFMAILILPIWRPSSSGPRRCALDLLERVVHRTPERRLRRLREILAERERDISRLRGRIGDLEAEVRAAATKGDDPG